MLETEKERIFSAEIEVGGLSQSFSQKTAGDPAAERKHSEATTRADTNCVAVWEKLHLVKW